MRPVALYILFFKIALIILGLLNKFYLIMLFGSSISLLFFLSTESVSFSRQGLYHYRVSYFLSNSCFQNSSFFFCFQPLFLYCFHLISLSISGIQYCVRFCFMRHCENFFLLIGNVSPFTFICINCLIIKLIQICLVSILSFYLRCNYCEYMLYLLCFFLY